MPQLNGQQFGYVNEPLFFPHDDRGAADFARAMGEASEADDILVHERPTRHPAPTKSVARMRVI